MSGELGAEYLVKHLPDTGQIVLTPILGGGEPCSAHRTAHVGEDRRAVRRIRWLHLSSKRRSTSLPI